MRRWAFFFVSIIATVSFLTWVSFQSANAADVGHGVDVSANVTVASDYVWRGDTQTNQGPAIQGGFDLSHNSGLYFGNWNSNVVGGTESDVYAGLTRGLFSTGLDYDVGAIGYLYPKQEGVSDFYELYVGLSTESHGVSPAVKVYYDPDNRNGYADGNVGFALTERVTANAHLGYVVPEDGESLYDTGIGVSCHALTLDWGVNYTDKEKSDDIVFFSVGKSF